MKLAERILGALKLGAMTADQLKCLLGVSGKSVRIALGELTAGRAVQFTHCARSRRFGAPPRLYWLADEKLVQLGTVSIRDALKVAKRIAELLFEHGEVAVFIDAKHVVRVALHHGAGYGATLTHQADQLVGRYRRQAEEPFKTAVIAEDIVHRLTEISRQGRDAA